MCFYEQLCMRAGLLLVSRVLQDAFLCICNFVYVRLYVCLFDHMCLRLFNLRICVRVSYSNCHQMDRLLGKIDTMLVIKSQAEAGGKWAWELKEDERRTRRRRRRMRSRRKKKLRKRMEGRPGKSWTTRKVRREGGNTRGGGWIWGGTVECWWHFLFSQTIKSKQTKENSRRAHWDRLSKTLNSDVAPRLAQQKMLKGPLSEAGR